MRVLLRNQATRLYLNPQGDWTLAREEARDFHNNSLAVRYAVDQNLSNLEIVFAFGSPQYDLTLPVERQRRLLLPGNVSPA